LNTGDKGKSWKKLASPTQETLVSIDFVDNRNGWICSRNSIIKTINGGESWEIIYGKDLGEGYFRDIKFLNENIGFAVGGKGSFGSIGFLIKTEDGGKTWQQASLNNLPTLTHISIKYPSCEVHLFGMKSFY
jgi:photosystem II stability/assembly factor-like uncharacterized protein